MQYTNKLITLIPKFIEVIFVPLVVQFWQPCHIEPNYQIVDPSDLKAKINYLKRTSYFTSQETNRM